VTLFNKPKGRRKILIPLLLTSVLLFGTVSTATANGRPSRLGNQDRHATEELSMC